jgi:hypothetical protein
MATHPARIDAGPGGFPGRPLTSCDLTGVGISPGSVPDRAWPGRPLLHTVRS